VITRIFHLLIYGILSKVQIDDRPKHIEKRIEAGHWEGDTIIGKNHKGAIITNVERKSGKLIATKVSNKTAQAILNATVLDFKDLPASLCVTMTYDNGKEFSFHKDIEDQTNFTVYFAHAYSPWERGTNENTNGLLRQFIPKGTDFDNVTDEDLQKYVNLINNRPRKRHGFKSPNYIFQLELDKVALETGI
jgi:IS30 family transposase